MASIALLIPCYNEALTIAKVISDGRKALPDARIVVFDNNSTDETAQIALKAGAEVIPEPHQGKGNVVKAMLEKIDADCYIMVDGDDTYDLTKAPDMARLVVKDGYDMVVGDRLSGDYYKENKRRFHGAGNDLVSVLVRSFFGKGITDVMTGFRAFSRKLAKSFHPRKPGFQIETEMSIFVLEKKMKVTSMTIGYRDRPAGSFSKLSTFKDGAKILSLIFASFFAARPLYALSMAFLPLLLAGAAVLISGFVLGSLPLLIAGVAMGSLYFLVLLIAIVLQLKRD